MIQKIARLQTDSKEKVAPENKPNKQNQHITYEYGLCSMHGRWLALVKTDVETFRVKDIPML